MDGAVTDYWIMTVDEAVLEAREVADDDPRYTANTLNLGDLEPLYRETPRPQGGVGERRVDADMTPPRLVITKPGFAPDALQTDGMALYLSARLRETLALSPREAQYFDVDATGSTDEVLAQDYKLVVFPLLRAPADPQTAARAPLEWLARPGDPDAELRHPPHARRYIRFDVRADFEADAEVFHADGVFLGPMVTDAFANRVRMAGIDAVAFRTPSEMFVPSGP